MDTLLLLIRLSKLASSTLAIVSPDSCQFFSLLQLQEVKLRVLTYSYHN